MSDKIRVGENFTVSKTDNIFTEVYFTYADGSVWEGCFPVYYPPLSVQFEKSEIRDLLPDVYDQLSPTSATASAEKTRKRWPSGTSSETYKVFESLLSGKWECRSCGAGKINDQPPARIRDIKKRGFIIATRTKYCQTCSQKKYHDILLTCEINGEKRSEFRKPISAKMKRKIISVLGAKDVFFDVKRPEGEFVIDHKFPSQRWEDEESDNVYLSDQEIRDKFQLLTNQSNMLKSRLCDQCCRTNIRPGFLGIKWFYQGDENWTSNDEMGGCYGCPWFDLEHWKKAIKKQL